MERELPDVIKTLIQRCEANETSFRNDNMSVALLFGETIWRHVDNLAEYYEKLAGNFMPGDVRANCFSDAAKDLRNIQKRTREITKHG